MLQWERYNYKPWSIRNIMSPSGQPYAYRKETRTKSMLFKGFFEMRQRSHRGSRKVISDHVTKPFVCMVHGAYRQVHCSVFHRENSVKWKNTSFHNLFILVVHCSVFSAEWKFRSVKKRLSPWKVREMKEVAKVFFHREKLVKSILRMLNFKKVPPTQTFDLYYWI